MKLVNKEEMQAIDKRTQEEFGISGLVLMEQAGERASTFLLENFGPKARYLVLAGTGNNGGDALVVARRLMLSGCRVWTYLLGQRQDLTPSTKANLSIYEKLGGEVLELSANIDKLRMALMVTDALVDGLLGIGLEGGLTDTFLAVTKIINESEVPVIALDIPTGVHATTGEVITDAIRADYTVTFGLPKLGLYLYPGPYFAGKIIVEPLSFPPELLKDNSLKGQITQIEDLAELKRPKESHKGTYGKGLLVAGSFGMCGAAALTGEAALRTGAGLVQALLPKEIIPIMQNMLPEMTIKELKLENEIEGYDCIMIGPGWGVTEENGIILRQLIKKAAILDIPLVLDADALTLLAEKDITLDAPAVLTPHPGEMQRLIKKDIQTIQKNRIGWAQTLSRDLGAVVVLKGAHTVIANVDGSFYINPTGNAGMATAGSGDVLTGIIGSLIMQGISLSQAAVTGVYLHGLAGDLAKENLGSRSLLARDIISFIPEAIKKIYGI